MNSVWLTSPFVKFNTDSLIYNETLCSETLFRSKFSIMDRSEKKDQKREHQKNCNVTSDYSSRSNLTEDKENEVNYTIKSRSVSNLRENVSTSNTLLKEYSKINLKETESESAFSDTNMHFHKDTLSRCSSNGTQEISISNDSNFDEVFVSDDKIVSLKSKVTGNRSNRFEENTRPFSNRMISEDRTIGDTLLSCPSELVEIYPGNDDLDKISFDLKRERSSMRSFPKEDDGSSKSVVIEENVLPLTKITSTQIKKEMCIVDDENVKCRKNNRDCEKNIYESFLPVQKMKEGISKSVNSNDDNFNATCRLNTERSMNSITFNGTKKSCTSKECSQNKILEESVDSKDSLLIENNSEILEPQKTCANDDFDKTSMKEASSVGISKEDLNVNLKPFLPEASMHNSCTNRNTKYTKDSSKKHENSNTDLLKMDAATIDTRKRKSNFEVKGITKNKSLKIINEVGEKEEESLDKINSSNEKKGLVQVDDKQNRGNQNVGQKAIEFVTAVSRDCIIEKNVTVGNNRKICDIFMKIHEQLLSHFERMESMWIKLEGVGSIDAVRLLTALSLLTSIISRCKNYIQNSNDNHKAEITIIKGLSNLIIHLIEAVDENKHFLEKQEQQMQSKWGQERNLHEKRRILNEVVSFRDHGLFKTYLIVQIISNTLNTIIADNKKQGNVRNPRQKSGVAEVKGLKVNLSKKENDVETELFKNSILKRLKSKPYMKSVCTQKYRGKENQIDDQNKTIDRKLNDNVRCPEKGKLLKKPTQSMNFERLKQVTSRQKCRTVNNLQPVWRPGGVVKFPSLSNVTVLPQKSRPTFTQATERLNQPMENVKEARRGRVGEPKKKAGSETYPVKSMNPEITSKQKPKLGVSKAPFKKYKDSCRPEPSSKNDEKTSSLEIVIRQTAPKQSKVLQILEEMIKSTPTDEKPARNTNKSMDRYQYRTKRNSTSIRQQIKIVEEEPTRDIDSTRLIKSQSKDKMFHEQQRSIEKIPQLSTAVMTSTNSISSSMTNDNEDVHSKSSFHLGKFQPKDNSSFTSATNTSFTADFTSSSDYITRLTSSKCCSTSPDLTSSKAKETEESSCSELRSPNFIEDNPKDFAIIRDKCEKSLVANEERFISTSQVISLTMLKEFLCEQGVDINLVNMAERYMKDKQKYRNCLKKKSASLADVMFNIQPIKGSENSLENFDRQERTLKGIMENYEDSKDSTDLEDIPETKGTLIIGGEKINKDASSQTKLCETETKGVQVVFEEDTALTVKQGTMETQTKMTAVKHAAIDCCIKIENATKFTDKSINASSMADLISVKDSFTQVVQASCSSKSVATEWSNCPKKLEYNFEKSSTDFIRHTSNEIYPKNSKFESHSTTKHSKQLLNKMEECSEVLLTNCEQRDNDYELHFDKLISSSRVKQSPKYRNNSDCNVEMDAKVNNLGKLTSSETMAALQGASIQVENLYKAIFIYQKHIESKLKKQEDEINVKKIRSKKSSKQEEILRNPLKNDSIDITIRDSCHSGKDIVNILSRLEFASSSDESEYDISRSISTSTTNILHNEQNTKESCTVLKDVKSLMEQLIQKMDDRNTEQVRCIERISSKTCSNIHIEISEMEAEKTEDCFSVFSRQNLLPFIYGIVCVVVFWCLHFTIVCDIVT